MKMSSWKWVVGKIAFHGQLGVVGDGGGGDHTIHMCMLKCLVCAARIVSGCRGTIFNVIGLLTGLKDGLEPRMVLYLKVNGLLPGLEDSLGPRMVLYLKVTRSSNP